MKEIEKTIQLEGGYVNNPADPGGETKYGISKKYHPTVDIANLTINEAIIIYQKEYWLKLNLDRFNFLPFRWKIFDIAVNQGPATAQIFLTHLKAKPDTMDAVHELIEVQMKRYVQKVIENPKKIIFLRGWANRAFDTGIDLL
jgi:lysozyme family protein